MWSKMNWRVWSGCAVMVGFQVVPSRIGWTTHQQDYCACPTEPIAGQQGGLEWALQAETSKLLQRGSCGKPLSPLRLWGHTDLPETHVGHPCFLYSFISVMYRVIYPLLLFISRSLTLVVNILGSCNSKSNVFQVNVEDMKLQHICTFIICSHPCFPYHILFSLC